MFSHNKVVISLLLILLLLGKWFELWVRGSQERSLLLGSGWTNLTLFLVAPSAIMALVSNVACKYLFFIRALLNIFIYYVHWCVWLSLNVLISVIWRISLVRHLVGFARRASAQPSQVFNGDLFTYLCFIYGRDI